MFTTITIITQDENRILPNGIRKRIIGGRTQIYERLKFNKQKGEAQHNNDYNKTIITLLKKWIRIMNTKKMTSSLIMRRKSNQFLKQE